MLESAENPREPALYKIDEFKNYRNQLGLNLIRNRDLANQTSKRSQGYVLQLSETKILSSPSVEHKTKSPTK